MIFYIKHRWWLALGVTLAWTAVNVPLGGWRDLLGSQPLWQQIALGVGGAILAVAVNGILHELFKRIFGRAYMTRFEGYTREILNRMTWREYLAGGLMAAVAEEPFFRGVLARSFDTPSVGVLVAAVVFALAHWIRPAWFGFWLWALWEGILFGILMIATGSLLVPIIAHGLHDVAAYAALAHLMKRQDAASWH